MFGPAGFGPFLGRPRSTITDAALPAADVFGPEIDRLEPEAAARTSGLRR